MNTFTKSSLVIAITMIAGCAVDTGPNLNFTPTSVPAPEKRPDSCQILRSDFKPAVADLTAPTATSKVERHFQRVIRHDCDGHVTSDKVETVLSPRFDIDLKLEEKWPHKSVFVFNETSCAHKLTGMPQSNPLIQLFAVTGNGKERVSLWGDLVTATLTFKMNEGLNNIYIRYYADCIPSNVPGNENIIVSDAKTPTCGTDAKTRTVLYPVNVEYTERTLEGAKDEYPSKSSCQPAAK